MGVRKHSVLNLFHKAAHQLLRAAPVRFTEGLCARRGVCKRTLTRLMPAPGRSCRAGSSPALPAACITCRSPAPPAALCVNETSEVRPLWHQHKHCFIIPRGPTYYFPQPELTHCLSSRTLTQRNGAVAEAAPVSAPAGDLCAPEAGLLLLGRDAGAQVRATTFWALGVFYFIFFAQRTDHDFLEQCSWWEPLQGK